MMENKPRLKKTLIITLIISIISSLIFILINRYEYNSYLKNYNNKINAISNNIKEKYPNLSNNEILEIIRTDNSNDFFKEYGYDIKEESIIEENRQVFTKYLIIEVSIIVLSLILISILYLKYNRNKDKEIKDIVRLVDSINQNNYDLDIDSISEEELSILKDKIYKITLTLRESADNSNRDKLSLKKSLEDISHQLRTPLTAILINIDNILDNKEIDDKQKQIFIRNIKREAYNIKRLIEAILKLSKFEVNTISYNRKYTKVIDLIGSSILNVSFLADLKNVKIEVSTNNKDVLYCDFNWEVEAITNILKNAIEHSYKDSTIKINCQDNKVYSKIEITNSGDDISKEDLKYIFERFYKGKNQNTDNFGIGLSLAKAIIEEDNGKIIVSSNNNKTTFTIKYYK